MIFLLGIITERHARVYGIRLSIKLRESIGSFDSTMQHFSNSVAKSGTHGTETFVPLFQTELFVQRSSKTGLSVLSGVIDPAQHSCLYLADANVTGGAF